MRELLNLTLLPPHLVVAVLGPAPAVDASGLDVAKGVRRDPDVVPGRRDTEGTDALQRCDVCDQSAGGIAIAKPFCARFARDPGGVRVTACEAPNRSG